MSLLKTTVFGLALVVVLVAAPSAEAANVELALGIDMSGSIAPADFTLQKTAYLNALSNAAILPLDGSVAVGVWFFASGVSNVFPTQEITGANIAALLASISGQAQSGGLTDIAGTITAASNQLLGNAVTSNRQVIDISTDGFQTVAGNPTTAAANAVAAGIEQVNGLGVGGGADLGWVPAGSFGITANSFADFQTALERKLVTEITGIPEPGTVALLGLGLLGLGGYTVRRRRSRTAA